MVYRTSLDRRQLFQLTVAGAATALVPGKASPDEPPNKAKPADVESLEAILGAIYDVISGPAKAPRNWDRFRSLFAPGARLIPCVRPRGGAVEPRVIDVEGFIQRSSQALEQQGFYEKEVARKVDRFGAIAHVFSTYESRRDPKDDPFVRGINSIQLLNDGTRWWVVTIYWDSERPDQPIPAEYLPK